MAIRATHSNTTHSIKAGYDNRNDDKKQPLSRPALAPLAAWREGLYDACDINMLLSIDLSM